MKKKKGSGPWLIKDENIQIIVIKYTIDANYNIDNEILILTIFEKRTDEFYECTNIIK